MMGVVKRTRLPGIPESGKSRVGLGRGERETRQEQKEGKSVKDGPMKEDQMGRKAAKQSQETGRRTERNHGKSPST